MMMKEQILIFLASNKGLLRDKYHIVRIGIFGSYARGDQNTSSDIDFLVEFDENTQDLYELKIDLKEFFRKQLGIEADICREKFIKPRLRSSIIKEAVYAY